MAGPEDKHGPSAPPPPSPSEAEDGAEDAVDPQREARALLDSASLGHATPMLEDRWHRYVATHADGEQMTRYGVAACEIKPIPGVRRCEFVVTTRNGDTWRWQPGRRAHRQMHAPSSARQPPGPRAANDTEPFVATQRGANDTVSPCYPFVCRHGVSPCCDICYGEEKMLDV